MTPCLRRRWNSRPISALAHANLGTLVPAATTSGGINGPGSSQHALRHHPTHWPAPRYAIAHTALPAASPRPRCAGRQFPAWSRKDHSMPSSAPLPRIPGQPRGFTSALTILGLAALALIVLIAVAPVGLGDGRRHDTTAVTPTALPLAQEPALAPADTHRQYCCDNVGLDDHGQIFAYDTTATTSHLQSNPEGCACPPPWRNTMAGHVLTTPATPQSNQQGCDPPPVWRADCGAGSVSEKATSPTEQFFARKRAQLEALQQHEWSAMQLWKQALFFEAKLVGSNNGR
jgi:hypothetical protein